MEKWKGTNDKKNGQRSKIPWILPCILTTRTNFQSHTNKHWSGMKMYSVVNDVN